MKTLIIDGYNVIFQAEPYAGLARAGEWDQARDALVSDVASYVGPDFRVTVVFDGAHNDSDKDKESEQLGVQVRFSSRGKTADAVIERLAKQAQARGDQIEIVSSDAMVQWTSLGEGVVRRSAKEFTEQLNFGYSEWERERDAPPKRSTLADRVGAEGAALLRSIRDGETRE